MLQEYKTKTNVFIGIGLILQIAAPFVGMTMESLDPILRIAGAVLLIIGCVNYAKGKGYNGAWGLLGLLSVIGLLILVCMRDKCKGK